MKKQNVFYSSYLKRNIWDEKIRELFNKLLVVDLELTEEEKKQARDYWNSLPDGKKILIETEFYSEQSPFTDDYAFDMLEILKDISPGFYIYRKK